MLDLSRVYGAAIRIWFAPHCTLNEFTNLFLDIANDQATHPADALTVSYGNPELSLFSCCGSTLFVGADAALSKITNGTNQKVALFVSSGDNGDESRHTTPTGTADVLFPASDFYVMAVGGTTVFPKSPTDVTRRAEFAWSGATTSNNGGSGGGISNIFALPPWQTGVPGTASQTYENLPDVASVASLESPPLMVLKGSLIQTGGTSAAAPTWAGNIALWQQTFSKIAGVTLTNWPAVLYGAPSIFTQITGGGNGRYQAKPGYNNVTGIGVPCIYGLVNPSLCQNGSAAIAEATEQNESAVAAAATDQNRSAAIPAATGPFARLIPHPPSVVK